MITNVMITNVTTSYPYIRILPSHPRFTLISVFYPLVRPSGHPSEHPSGHPFVHPSIRNRVLTLPAAIADNENDIAKRVHTSKGDTPGKHKNKAPRLSRKKYPRSSRALF